MEAYTEARGNLSFTFSRREWLLSFVPLAIVVAGFAGIMVSFTGERDQFVEFFFPITFFAGFALVLAYALLWRSKFECELLQDQIVIKKGVIKRRTIVLPYNSIRRAQYFKGGRTSNYYNIRIDSNDGNWQAIMGITLEDATRGVDTINRLRGDAGNQ